MMSGFQSHMMRGQPSCAPTAFGVEIQRDSTNMEGSSPTCVLHSTHGCGGLPKCNTCVGGQQGGGDLDYPIGRSNRGFLTTTFVPKLRCLGDRRLWEARAATRLRKGFHLGARLWGGYTLA